MCNHLPTFTNKHQLKTTTRTDYIYQLEFILHDIKVNIFGINVYVLATIQNKKNHPGIRVVLLEVFDRIIAWRTGEHDVRPSDRTFESNELETTAAQ